MLVSALISGVFNLNAVFIVYTNCLQHFMHHSNKHSPTLYGQITGEYTLNTD